MRYPLEVTTGTRKAKSTPSSPVQRSCISRAKAPCKWLRGKSPKSATPAHSIKLNSSHFKTKRENKDHKFIAIQPTRPDTRPRKNMSKGDQQDNQAVIFILIQPNLKTGFDSCL